MKELEKTYNPADIEERLYQKWLDSKYFHAEVNKNKKPFTIVMPPPNITGQLHMGHALDNTMQDILIRYKRMQGFEALWQPGTDHAAIATEVKVIDKLKSEGIDKHDLGRDKFLEKAYEICVCDWSSDVCSSDLRDAPMPCWKYLQSSMKKDIFTKAPELSTGVQSARLPSPMPK